ncbi:hypothetical protein V1512DRAFT_259739 [Lipomyces arxii]|uniref:uncharacterized protein n=1 Tax=Lipomyces arxii TaxID=56418 RepID=UPI0034CFDCE4
MYAFECSGPVWDYDDFTLCFRQKFLQVLVPLFLVSVSFIVLFSNTLKKWLFDSRSPGYIPISEDDRAAFREDAPEAALLAEEDDAEDLQIYRLNTAVPGRHTNDEDENGVHLTLDDDERQNEADDYKVTIVNPRGSRFRVACEEVFLFSEVSLHVIAIASLMWYSPAREDWEHYGLRALIGSLYWCYAIFLVNLRLSKPSEFKPSYLWAHILVLYVIAWINAFISARSAIIHPYMRIIDYSAGVDLFLTTFLVGFGLCMNTSDKPIYIESRHGYVPNTEPLASIASKMSFYFAQPIISLGYSKILTMDDVWDLKEEDRSGKILKQFRKHLKTVSFAMSLFRFFKWQLILGVTWSLVHACFAFLPSIVVRIILQYLEDPVTTPLSVALLFVGILFVSTFLGAMANGQALWNGRVVCIRIRAIIIGELYAKALKRKAAAHTEVKDSEPKADGEEAEKEETDVGGVINLMAVDAFKVGEVCAYFHFVIGGVAMLIVAMVLLYKTLGLSALAGAFTMISILPAHWYISHIFGIAQGNLMKATDKRVHKTNEVLNSIKIIKYFAWESRFFDIVSEARRDELNALYRRFLIWAASAIVWYGAPILITLMTFGFYTIVAGHTLTTPVAFSSLALFNLMRIPLDSLAEVFTNILQSKTSVERIQDFLVESETEKYTQLTKPRADSDSPYLGFEKATFSWATEPTNRDFKLENMDIDFKVGSLNLIVGPTGSGKTSLLMALLGEMKLLSGHVYLPGVTKFGEEAEIDPESGLSESVAYCAQQAWLLNDTVKNNIIFGNVLDAGRYKVVVEACGLKRDFEILEGGDETEVGERGIALSGGQKQRISLARALYSPARHLLLDDVLSAVDSHTAVWIYENCIMGPLMLGRTVILVSHNVALTLPGAKHVIVLEKGTIAQQGSVQEVLDSEILGDDDLIKSSVSNAQSRNISRNASVANLQKQLDIIAAEEAEPAIALPEDIKPANSKGVDSKNKYKLVLEEGQSTGNVKLSVYLTYMKALGGVGFWFMNAAFFGVFQYLIVGQSWWIRTWADGMSSSQDITDIPSALSYVKSNLAAPVRTYIAASLPSSIPSVETIYENTMNLKRDVQVDIQAHSTYYYLFVYALFTGAYLLIVFMREGYMFIGSLAASRSIFEKLLHRVMRAKPRFFDATPIGRIMNRFSKDMEITDQEIAPVFVSLGHSVLSVVVIICIVTYIMPMFLFAAAGIMLMFWIIVKLFLSASREVKRMDAVTRSPIYQHFGETLVGITTIRAYGYEDRFIKENEERIDDNNRPFWSVWVCNRWMSYRVDVVSSLVSFFTAVFVLIFNGKIDSGLAGLSLTYAVMFADGLMWFVWLYAMNEMNMNSVERINEYMYIEQEAPEVIDGHRPPSGWPAKGAIKVDDLSLRYAPGLPFVIKNVTFEIKPTQKIGIVGRTGAGKSTIASAFFRFLEAETGKIIIDGIDISDIGLKDLRSAITIIPQDPTLFTGTIRSNLDPFDNYSDEAVFKSLLRVHLIDAIPRPGDEDTLDVTERHKRRITPFYDLSSPVSEGGNNLSQGQRQLMCLARSLLRSPKVILLDEATASIDYNTDAQIQETIREEFSDTTIITIAHRLRSIIDYDMILVLDAGEVKEFAKPHTLLQTSGSIFKSMCENSGEYDQLEELAAKAYAEQTAGEGSSSEFAS